MAVPSAPVITGAASSGRVDFTQAASIPAVTSYRYSVNGAAYTLLSPADATTPIVLPQMAVGATLSLKAVNADGDSTVATFTVTAVLVANTLADIADGTLDPDLRFVSIPASPSGGTIDPDLRFAFAPADVSEGLLGFAPTFAAIPPEVYEGSTAISISVGTLPSDPAEGWMNGLPRISSISPVEGPIAGNTLVTLTGFNFTGVTGVTFGGVPGTSVNFISDTEVEVLSPAASVGGIVDIVLTSSTYGVSPAAGTDNDFLYFAPLTISGVDPVGGSVVGNTTVEITGTGFTGTLAADVKFDTSPVTSIVVNSDNLMTATTPAHALGLVNVVVTNRTTVTLTNGYTYFTPPTIVSLDVGGGAGVDIRGPIVGGTRVTPITGLLTITGTGFTAPLTVSFDGGTPITVSPTTSTQLEVIPPVHTASLGVNITIVTNAGSVTTSGLPYRYYAPLVVSSVSPNHGTKSGGTPVTITGTGFLNASSVEFDGVEVGSFTVNSDTSISTTTPGPHVYGGVVVGVETDLE